MIFHPPRKVETLQTIEFVKRKANEQLMAVTADDGGQGDRKHSLQDFFMEKKDIKIQ